MAWVNEIYDALFDANTICVASISYGKDSLAMLRAIKLLGLPLHRIIHSEVWATDTIPADLPPMVEFKKRADKIIKDLYGIEVEHICATRPAERESYESMFYRRLQSGKFAGTIKGFPQTIGSWCKKLKTTGEVDVRRYLLSEIFQAEGRKEGRKFVRVPDSKRTLVQQRTQSIHSRQTYTDSQVGGTVGVTNSNSFPKAPARGAK